MSGQDFVIHLHIICVCPEGIKGVMSFVSRPHLGDYQFPVDLHLVSLTSSSRRVFPPAGRRHWIMDATSAGAMECGPSTRSGSETQFYYYYSPAILGPCHLKAFRCVTSSVVVNSPGGM